MQRDVANIADAAPAGTPARVTYLTVFEIDPHALSVHIAPLRRCELEHHAGSSIASAGRGSVKIAGRVADHTCLGETPIGPAAEAVEHRLVTGVSALYITPQPGKPKSHEAVPP